MNLSRTAGLPRSTLLAATFLVAGCLQPQVYPCADDLECLVGGVQGTCHSSGFCAYPDGRCPSQARFGPAAGGGRALECVPNDTIGEAESIGESQSFVGESSTASSSAASSGTSTVGSEGCSGCDTPPGDCWAAQGSCSEDGCVYDPLPMRTTCTIDDACVMAAECDGAGECVATVGMACDDPPGPCFAAQGECQQGGTCVYDPLPANSDCDDDDECTIGEQCDAAGVCGGGELCPDDDPCTIAGCVDGQCETSPEPDGTSCGVQSADRCCAGACVDISSDEANCGGCGLECDADDTCQSVASTSSCELAPTNTSGRCTCDAANADCPHSQVCRTVTPFANVCTPNDAGGCVNDFQDVNLCPNFCFYP